ncbi:vacuolar protein sorting-associated protein Vps17 [Sodiomyces alkalinus F11]|uniref:Vacuolar protein sorting-associated protein 17 n=1 Tax=Sodiomyces alkalinus (strain CBS 110278 / VKM F-3762 / F11) TaxID=1314773 RepID=A0A3N2Q1I0_SODAK|nr:vacuolar protein sorting-associated protein Vps17 [Sodiomyces alkalinus F11]ROT40617.1 vacuolar protein sorting-associated protein Vps17 [Sodiomyces alkalinus F11]
MDYSASMQDDNPVGASPWGNSPTSSPRHQRTGFGSVLGDEPPVSPFRNGLPQDQEGGFGSQDTSFRRPDTASTTSGTEPGINESATTVSSGAQHHDAATPFGHDTQSGPETPQKAPDHESASAPGPQGQQSQHPSQPQKPQYRLVAKISGLERTGKKDPVLRFDVHTNIPRFRTTQYRDVRRLHSEFVKLADHLISANPEVLVPAVPPPLTSAGAGTEEDEVRVRGLMQRWFNYVCSNEVLMRDDEMVLFVESDFGYSPMVKMKQPATGVRRKILKQFAPPPDDTPELQEARPIVKLFYLGTMDAGHKVDKLVKSRRGLGLSESDFGVKLGAMNVQEPHQGLANAYRKLGKAIQTMGDYHAAQATAHATTIGDPFQYHSSDAFIVKETLTNRQILIREFLQAQEVTRSKLNAADRLKASSNVRREKVDEAITALDEARRNETYLYQKTTCVTQNLVHERRKWFARTAADLRLSIREYVLREIEAERRTLALLESVRPDIRSIDSSGGLSRLGREAHPTVRRTSLAASQGPKGDAWSGVPRRSDTISRSVSGGMVPNLAEDSGEGEDGQGVTQAKVPGTLTGVAEEDAEDRLDARNAASRLAASTF